MSDKGVEILIVEDSPTQAEQLKYLLEDRGHSVNIATNGKQALDKLREYRPALVISDIVMPEIDGYTLCKKIKSDKNLRGIPVILVTALSDPDDIIKGLEVEADNFIMKPYDEKYLLKTIQHILVNLEFQQEKPMQMGMEIFFRDKKYFITADRLQILTLLLSTYETAVEKNLNLVEAQNELKKLNEELEDKVRDRTSALVEEIAERKRTEEKLLKANRSLKTLSSCNEVLVRAKDEPELLKNICQILIDIGGYRMAWVGFAEHDESKTVRPAASAGYEMGFLTSIKVTWADNQYGQCPVSTAIRISSPVIVNDLRTDPGFEPHSEEAIKREYVSIIGLPLKDNSHTFGVLAIYSSEPDIFDDDELKLLTELANDLAYGIMSLRTRAVRRKAEEALQESEQRFKSIFDNAADGILIADVENKKFLSGNSMICKMLGYSEEEIKNLGMMDIHPEKDLVYVIEQFEKQASGKFTLARDLPVKRKDGSVFYTDINSFPITLAGKTYLVGIFRDVTERKRAEEELKNEKAFTESALNILSDVFFVFNLEGRFLRWNKTANVVLGYTDEEISSLKPTDFFSGEDIKRITDAIEKVIKEGYTRVEAEFITKDNKKIPYEITGSLLKDANGNYIGVSGVGRNITERKRIEYELLRREEELKKRVQELEDFYNMSVGRELRMIELKKEIERLNEEMARYKKDA